MKQTSISTSTIEVKYMTADSCFSQLLWLNQQLRDYHVIAKNVPIFCDSNNATTNTQNLVLHTRCKHVDVRNHFIRDYVEKKDIRMEKIHTDIQRADILTKSLADARFHNLSVELGLLDFGKCPLFYFIQVHCSGRGNHQWTRQPS